MENRGKNRIRRTFCEQLGNGSFALISLSPFYQEAYSRKGIQQ
jgi:hypothetical protein